MPVSQKIDPALLMLRDAGAQCRLLPRGEAGGADHVAALLCALTGSGGCGRLRMYERSAREHSFDEAWVLALLAAARRGDEDSLAFLLRRRVPLHRCRSLAALVRQVAHGLGPDLESF